LQQQDKQNQKPAALKARGWLGLWSLVLIGDSHGGLLAFWVIYGQWQ
jgi:hypothetical protein